MQRSRGRRSTRIWRPMNECVMSGTLKIFRFVLVSTKRHLTKLVFDSFYYSFFKTISVLLEKSITIRFDWTLKFSFQLTVNWLFFSVLFCQIVSFSSIFLFLFRSIIRLPEKIFDYDELDVITFFLSKAEEKRLAGD